MPSFPEASGHFAWQPMELHSDLPAIAAAPVYASAEDRQAAAFLRSVGLSGQPAQAAGAGALPAAPAPVEWLPAETAAPAPLESTVVDWLAAAPAAPAERRPGPPSGRTWSPAEIASLPVLPAEPDWGGLSAAPFERPVHSSGMGGRGPGERHRDAERLALEARRQAAAHLEQAQQQAARILAEADAEAKRRLDQAAEALGLAQAQAQASAAEISRQSQEAGRQAAHAETEAMLQAARSLVEETRRWREQALAQGEMMMLRLVIDIAQTLFGDGLPLDPEALGHAYGRALAQAKPLGDLRIYVHPDDANALSPHWLQNQASLTGQGMELIPSEIIKRGGCFIDGQYGSVDARVETQLKLVEDTLMAAHERSQSEDQDWALPPEEAE